MKTKEMKIKKDPLKKINETFYALLLVVVAVFGLGSGKVWGQTPFGTWDHHIAITETGAGTWEVPVGVTEIQVEVIGAGGGGGARSTGNGGWGGAGGGAYARSLLTVTPEATLNYSVGSGGSGASGTAAQKTGGDTWFINATTVMAKGGIGVANSTAAGSLGGQADASFGDIKFNGGRGANGQNNTTTTRRGGGGGGAAGPAAAGNYTTSTTDRLAGTSGGAPGGDGGEAFDGNFANGRDGESYGGGGSGGCTSSNGNVNGGNGAGGLIIIAWNSSCDAEITSTTPASRCGEGTVSLEATAVDGIARWFDAEIGGTQVGTGSSFNTSTITETTTFWVEAYDAGDDCSSAREAVLATVNAAPVVTTQPVAQFACPENGTAVFSVDATTTGTTTYQWQVDEGSGFSNVSDGGVYSGATTATLTITDAPLALNNYTYRVVINDDCGTVDSDGAVLSVSAENCANEGDYRSVQSGNWNATSTWERFDGTAWIDATTTPGSTLSVSVAIRQGHTVTNNLNYSAGSNNNVVVSGTLLLNNGSTTNYYNFNTLTIQETGLVEHLSGRAKISGETIVYGEFKRSYATNINEFDGGLIIEGTGKYNHNINGGSIPTATWNVGSTCEVSGTTGATSFSGGLNQTFSRVIYNSPGQTSTWIYFRPQQVTKELVIQNTGTGRVLLYGGTGATPQLDISGDLIINGGIAVNDYSSGEKTRTAKVGGNVIVNGGTLTIAEANNSSSRTSLEIGKSFKLTGGTFRLSLNSPVAGGEGYLDVQDSILLLSGTLAGDLNGASGFYAIGNGANQHVQVDIPFGEANPFRRRFFYRTASGPSGLNEEYNTPTDNSMQFTIDGTGAAPRAGHASWPTSGELIQTIKVNNGSDVTLSTNKTVNDEFTFEQGKFITASCESTTNSGNILHMADNSTISGFDSDKYVVGIVQKTGDDAFVFPVGSIDAYEPVSITAPSDASDKFGVCFMNQDPGPLGYDRDEIDDDLEKVAECHFWYVNRMEGASSVRIGLRNDCIALAEIVGVESIARWNGSKWVNEGGVENDGKIVSNPINAFSPFTTSDGDNTALPVDMVSFSAQCEGETTQLTWVTASEVNSHEFILERSRDGQHWTEVAVVPAAGTSTNLITYQVPDERMGLRYYRLIQVDFDGQYEVFGPISANCAIEKDVIAVYPNPTSGDFVVQVDSKEDLGRTGYSILDASGKLIYQSDAEIAAGRTNIYVSRELENGIYFIRLHDEKGLFNVGKVIVK